MSHLFEWRYAAPLQVGQVGEHVPKLVGVALAIDLRQKLGLRVNPEKQEQHHTTHDTTRTTPQDDHTKNPRVHPYQNSHASPSPSICVKGCTHRNRVMV